MLKKQIINQIVSTFSQHGIKVLGINFLSKVISNVLLKQHKELLKNNCVYAYFSEGVKFVAISNGQVIAVQSVKFNQNGENFAKLYVKFVEKQKIVDFLNSYQATISSKDALNTISKNNEVLEKTNDYDLSIQNAPAVKFVDSIIREAIPLKASDIHIEPDETEVVIRYRIDGDLIEWAKFPIASYAEISARIKILSNIDIAEKRIPQDGRITLRINDEDVNFRVSTLPTIHGEKFVIRILDSKIFSYSLKELNFSSESYKLIDKFKFW